MIRSRIARMIVLPTVMAACAALLRPVAPLTRVRRTCSRAMV